MSLDDTVEVPSIAGRSRTQGTSKKLVENQWCTSMYGYLFVCGEKIGALEKLIKYSSSMSEKLVAKFLLSPTR